MPSGFTAKERMSIPRQEMPTQDAEERAGNFEEVALGLTLEMAQLEAERCLQCAKPHCVEGCPVGVMIPQFIKALREGDLPAAVEYMQVKNNLPAICGRVCPQESQCEAVCVLTKKGQSVAIGRLERYVGDYAIREQHRAAIARAAHRQAGRRGRLRPFRADLRRGSGQAGPQSHDF